MYRVRFSAPARGLETFVRFYCEREACIRDRTIVHPVPARAAPMLEFILADSIKVHYSHQHEPVTSPTTVLVGVQTYPRVQIQLHGMVHSFVIMFQPAGLYQLFGVPAHYLSDRDFEAHSVLGHTISALEQQLGECSTFAQRAALADAFLHRRALGSRTTAEVAGIASHMVGRDGCVRLPELAGSAGLSTRQFERRFVEAVGVNPKLCARIIRFQAALDSKARDTTRSWAEVAQQFGYFDQSHMNHDFRQFTGSSPVNALGQLEAVFQNQIAAIRAGASFPASSGNPRLIL
ncbi:MAG: AraC family transcriptional regulator [Acidobacteriaceae bacterium]